MTNHGFHHPSPVKTRAPSKRGLFGVASSRVALVDCTSLAVKYLTRRSVTNFERPATDFLKDSLVWSVIKGTGTVGVVEA